MKSWMKLVPVIAMLMMFAVAAPAADYSANYNSTDTESFMLTKLGRGVANIAFGGLELLKQPYDVNENMGGIAALTYGVLRGVGFTVARIGVGVVDVVTFPFPLPGCKDDPEDYGWGYGPILRPAWVMDIEHNPYGFFYDKTVVAE